MEFVCELYEEQVGEGRYFLHEHPDGALSWKDPQVVALMQHHRIKKRRVRSMRIRTGDSQHER